MPPPFDGRSTFWVAALASVLASACDLGPQQPDRHGPSAQKTGDDDTQDAHPVELDADALLPSRIRRLSTAEYRASVRALLGDEVSIGSLAPDARQDGFTVNDAQRVDPVLAQQLFGAGEAIALRMRPRLAALAPCDDPSHPEPCARAFIASFGARAYRRPLDEAESLGLLEVYRAGADGADYVDGIALVVQALLQSAGMLYVTELGTNGDEGASLARLSSDEIASALSYLFTSAPPDQALRAAARAGVLDDPEARVREVRRLRREHPDSEAHLIRMVHEWLKLDLAEGTAKDSKIYPGFERIKADMLRENRAFVAAVLADDAPSAKSDVEELLGAEWTIAGGELAAMYGGRDLGGGRMAVPGRRGLLNRAAFLSVHAHAHESTPVPRGALVAKRLACQPIPSPSSLKIEVVPPVPDPKLTTRERFAAHSTDLVCMTCHLAIDSLGNAFEQFDGMGAHRTTENGRPVDPSTSVSLGLDFDGPFADSNALAVALSKSAFVRECFARHMFRAAVGRSGELTAGAEDAFISLWKTMPESRQGNVMDTLEAFVASPLFIERNKP